MSGRSYFPIAAFAGSGYVIAAFSFLTNSTSDPAVSSFRGCGGLSGADTSGAGVSNSGPSIVKSILRKGVGDFEITLADGYRYVLYESASLGFTAGSPDGFDAFLAEPTNEGAGRTTPIVIRCSVVNTSGAGTETTGRRVRCFIVLKDSAAGA